MNNISIRMSNNSLYTLVSNYFIENLMPQANGEFVKIYLYFLKCIAEGNSSISLKNIASVFNCSENDILRALRYWNSAGALRLEFDINSGELSCVSFITPDRPLPSSMNAALQNSQTQNARDEFAYSKEDSFGENLSLAEDYADSSHKNVSSGYTSQGDMTHDKNSKKDSNLLNKKSQYTPVAISELSNHEDFSMLTMSLSMFLGPSLNASGIQTIAFIYDTLKFPTDLIEYLVEYCMNKGHKSMRYIETVAINWHDAGIKTIEQAKAQSADYNEAAYSVMKAFGLNNRAPGIHEQNYINRWTDEYCFDLDIIIEACNRTIKATHQPSFEYADSILKRWKSQNVKDYSDIRRSDAEFELLKNKKPSANTSGNSGNTSAKPVSTNKFNNFDQRNTNINDLESSLLNN